MPFTSPWTESPEGPHGGGEVCRPCFLLCSISRIVSESSPAAESAQLRRILAVLQLAYDVARDLEFSHAAEAVAGGCGGSRQGGPGVPWDVKGRHGAAWEVMGRHGTAWDVMGRHGTSWGGMGRHGTTWDDMERHGTTWNDM